VWDLVLVGSGGTSSLVALLSSVADLIKDRIDATTTNGVRLGARSALAMILSHLPELEAEPELLGSWHNADLTKDQMDALRTQMC
jgi:hypothetical protein